MIVLVDQNRLRHISKVRSYIALKILQPNQQKRSETTLLYRFNRQHNIRIRHSKQPFHYTINRFSTIQRPIRNVSPAIEPIISTLCKIGSVQTTQNGSPAIRPRRIKDEVPPFGGRVLNWFN